MCGISGFMDVKGEGRIDRSVIERMTDSLGHRGPDDVGTYLDHNVALGFNRLSIVDIDGGRQPLHNEDHSITLICNGEIFNYRELREQLCARGHSFRTKCDVEVIVHLYEEYDIDFIHKLNGQFAFALYDGNRKRLLCARDRAGIAPFYYTVSNQMFIFASEIKAILQHDGVARQVDLTGLDQILNFPGMVSPRTLFQGIQSLEGGHYLMVDHEQGVVNREYWDLIYPKLGEADYFKDEDEYIGQLDELLTKAVDYRLQADVPVGFYISGGLDSSIIAAKIRGLGGQRRNSFSIDFTERSLSEGRYQRLMAEQVDSEHHEIIFNFNDIDRRLRKAVYHSECALKETYNTASLALSEHVHAHNIKVILTGEGADELFGGYVGYRFDKMKQQQKVALTDEMRLENRLRNRIWGDAAFLYEKNHYAFSQLTRELYSDQVNAVYEQMSCYNHPIINHERIKDVHVFHKRSYIDFKLRMSDHLLADHGDRMAFAHSVEARYPFLDPGVIEFARMAPPDIKLKNYTEKYILKKLAASLVPQEIINRPKFAFVAPGSPDLLKMDREYIGDILSHERIRKQGFFNPDTVDKLRKQYTADGFKLNVPYDTDLLITVITFGIFLEEFGL